MAYEQAITPKELRELLDFAERAVALTPWEQRFVDDMKARLEQYGDRTAISAAQARTARNIAGRL